VFPFTLKALVEIKTCTELQKLWDSCPAAPKAALYPAQGLFRELKRGISVLYVSILLPGAYVAVVKVSLNCSSGQCVIAILRYYVNPKCEPNT